MTKDKGTVIGYFDFSRGKFIDYGSKEDRATRQRVSNAKPKAPRQKSPLTEFKECARKVGTYAQVGHFAKVEIKGTILILDADYPEVATDIVMAYAQTGDDDCMVKIAPDVLLDADYEDDADEILQEFGLVKTPAVHV